MDFSSSPDRIVYSKADAGLAKSLDGGTGFASVDDCQVVAACLNHELAQEAQGDDGVRHGLLSRAFVTEVGHVESGELQSVPWARVWQKMRESVETANPMQHLWMSGNEARAILAGPPVDGDAGFAVRKTGPNEYAIDAGTLADVSEGAKLAVYKDTPKLFPTLGTPEDLKARVDKSLLVVQQADRASAVARCEAEPFELPAGARARLVAAGKGAKLRCAVVPQDDKIASELKASELLELVDEREAQALLERQKDGDMEAQGRRQRCEARIPRAPDPEARRDRPRKTGPRNLSRYSLPLRMATRCTDFPGQLQVKLLACPDGLPEEEAQKADLPEVARHKALNYALKVGSGFCVHVRNGSIRPLRVVLVNCATSGRVEFLGDQIIDPRSYYRFWEGNTQGVPFEPRRLAGIARTSTAWWPSGRPSLTRTSATCGATSDSRTS